MKDLAKHLIKKTLSSLGVEVHRLHQRTSQPLRTDMTGSLQQIRRLGFQPETILDVGVAEGTPALYDIFPNARFILIEPLKEFVPHLERLVNQLIRCEYLIAAAASAHGQVVINVHPGLNGSSVFKEEEEFDINGVERVVPTVVLDDICHERGTKAPYMIKIDVQGAEIDVLKGCEVILADTELVVLETSLFEFFKGAPQIYDYIHFMKERSFVMYDIFNLQYRPLDGAMSQVDIAFVPEQSRFRKYHFYATREQRSDQFKSFNQTIRAVDSSKG